MKLKGCIVLLGERGRIVGNKFDFYKTAILFKFQTIKIEKKNYFIFSNHKMNIQSDRQVLKMRRDKRAKMPGSVNMFSTFKTSSHASSKSPLMDAPYSLDAHYAFPPESNKMHYLPYDQKDSDDFKFEMENKAGNVDRGLPTRIVCQNPGKWEIVNQYQLDCLRTSSELYNITGVGGPHQISGFTVLGNVHHGDGHPLDNSSATCTVEKKGDKVVLVIAYTVDLKKGDYFKVGVVSSDCSVAIINSYPGVTNLVDPICITLCNKLK